MVSFEKKERLSAKDCLKFLNIGEDNIYYKSTKTDFLHECEKEIGTDDFLDEIDWPPELVETTTCTPKQSLLFMPQRCGCKVGAYCSDDCGCKNCENREKVKVTSGIKRSPQEDTQFRKKAKQ